MDLKLSGKSALVTGSTAGIGYAIAAALANEGARVWINGRTEARVSEAVRQIGKSSVRGIASDLGSADGVRQLVAQLPEVDILINNVGIFEARPFAEISDADWLKFFEVNVLSGVRLSRCYLPGMLKRNWGRVIFISSESAVNPPAEMVHYGTTKTAQLAVARGLAEMTAGTAVTVNSVLPGPTRSEGVEEFVRKIAESKGTDKSSFEKEFFRTMRPTSLLKRFIECDEVAAVTAFLCSPLAAAVNGAAVRVDGGVVRSVI